LIKDDIQKERKQIMESKTGGIIEQRICCTEANPGPIPSSLMLRPRQIPKLKFRERFQYDDFKMVYRYLALHAHINGYLLGLIPIKILIVGHLKEN